MNVPDRIKWLEARGANTDWWYKLQKNGQVNKSKEELKQKRCGQFSILQVQYAAGKALMHTIYSDGSPYMVVRTEATQKTGAPVWWCTCCGSIFAVWADCSAHFDHNQETQNEQS